jgi:2-polyprenyl-6-hydroxyphenyl methylase/3-demethylubiquinone-9 3-methyltransferase
VRVHTDILGAIKLFCVELLINQFVHMKYSIHIALVSVLMVLWTRRNSKLNDLSIYNTADWWTNDSSFSILRRMNLVRIPYFVSRFPENTRVIIDVGCGGGFVAEDLTKMGYTVTGFDISEESLKKARDHAKKSKLNIQYNTGSIYSIPMASGSVDVVVVSDVLEHLDDVPRALKEIKRVLKPGGVFVFDTIARTVWSYLTTYLGAQQILGIVEPGAHDWSMFIEPDELEMMIREAGFDTDRQSWAGIGSNLSLMNAVKKGSKYDFIESFFKDNSDFSSSYMGSAISIV